MLEYIPADRRKYQAPQFREMASLPALKMTARTSARVCPPPVSKKKKRQKNQIKSNQIKTKH